MLLLIDELLKLSVEVEVVSINPIGQLGPLLDERGVLNEGSTYSGPWGLFSILRLHRILSQKRADGLLMIGHNLMGELALGRLWKKHRALSIHYHHRGVKSPIIWKLIYYIAVNKFRSIIFVSDYIKQEALQIVPFLSKKELFVSTQVETHPPFTHKERLEARIALKIPVDTLVVGNAGWLIERKRWDVYLQVAAKVIKQEPTVRFIIAGDGPLREDLKKMALDLGVANNIIWLGWQSDLLPFYRSIDILLFNSDWDAQARTPLESMSYGIPVVASVLEGGTKEMITDPSMGILFDDHNVDSLAEAIIRMKRDPVQMEKTGSAGRQRVLVQASPKDHAQRVLAAMGFPVMGDY